MDCICPVHGREAMAHWHRSASPSRSRHRRRGGPQVRPPPARELRDTRPAATEAKCVAAVFCRAMLSEQQLASILRAWARTAARVGARRAMLEVRTHEKTLCTLPFWT